MNIAPFAVPTDLTPTVARALAEDLGRGDITAAAVPGDTRGEATVISREEAVLCGTPWFNEVFRQLDGTIEVQWRVSDGDAITPSQLLCQVRGPARAMLSGERTALNFLQCLSGTATLARRYAEAVEGTRAKVLDTRKTLPGLRSAQKYAVRCGGCYNHRHGLDDGILIKENHIVAAGSITAAVHAARTLAAPGINVEVEVENLDQVQEAVEAGADILLLDNFELEALDQAEALCRGLVLTEASGNVTLHNIRAIAETGVDFISTGAMTKDVKAVDLSMRFAPPTPHAAPDPGVPRP